MRKTKEDDQEDNRVLEAHFEQAAISVAKFLEVVLEAKLEADQRIAALYALRSTSSSSCSCSRYLAMVGTTVRESR